MNKNELRKYKENSFYSIDDIAEKLIQLSNLEQVQEIKEDLEKALSHLKAVAQNEYNSDYFRTFYNVLSIISGFECL